MPKYDVLVGCNYPPGDTRAEPGDVIDVPEEIGRALVRADAAKLHKAPSGPRKSKAPDTTTHDASGAPDGGEG